MKINELRIGNWVSHEDYSTEMFKVKDIYCDCGGDCYVVNTIGGKNGTWLNHIDLILPIPLTEKLLLKCGFEKYFESRLRVSYEHKYKYINYLFSKEKNDIYTTGLHFSDKNIGCLYLHELQNAIYALTGTELEIKL